MTFLDPGIHINVKGGYLFIKWIHGSRSEMPPLILIKKDIPHYISGGNRF
jgi:hypothetical protein